MNKSSRIYSELKSKRIVLEPDKPLRYSFMKILREYSTLKQFYPEINPYAEVYQFRKNMWAIFTESFDGAGDPWMFLIEGPQKNLLIDTAFGVGDLKGLIKKIVGDKKPLIVVNTHSHYDHAYGNCQFDICYCHEYEVPRMKKVNNPHIWDYLFDSAGKPIYTEFDKNDIIPFHKYQIVGIPNGHMFDLGNGYFVEAVHLPGHTPGQCGYYDHQNHTIFIGDTNGITSAIPGEPYSEFCTVKALRNALNKLSSRFHEIEGVFPGHGMLDQPACSLQYILDAADAVVRYPQRYDSCSKVEKKGRKFTMYMKNIYQGSAIRYTENNVK